MVATIDVTNNDTSSLKTEVSVTHTPPQKHTKMSTSSKRRLKSNKYDDHDDDDEPSVTSSISTASNSSNTNDSQYQSECRSDVEEEQETTALIVAPSDLNKTDKVTTTTTTCTSNQRLSLSSPIKGILKNSNAMTAQSAKDVTAQPPKKTNEEILDEIITNYSNEKMNILIELVGATNLSLIDTSIIDDVDAIFLKNNWNNDAMKPYCIVRLGDGGNGSENNGSRIIHRTKKAGGYSGNYNDDATNGGSNPIWTFDTKSLCLLESMTPIDLLQNKLIIQLYTKRQQTNELAVVGESLSKVTTKISNTAAAVTTLGGGGGGSSSGSENNDSSSYGKDIFLGQVQLNVKDILDSCNDDESRIEYTLRDELNEIIPLKKGKRSRAKLALRFRFATKSDIDFIHTWNNSTANTTSTNAVNEKQERPKFNKEKSKRHLLLEELHHDDDGDEDDVIGQGIGDITNDSNNDSEYRKNLLRANSCFQGQLQGDNKRTTTKKVLGKLITEEDETQIAGSTFVNALSSAFTSSSFVDKRTGKRKFRMKPNPNPKDVEGTQYMTKHEIKLETRKPSHYFVEAGSGNVGKLYVEILSCHDLPNVDIGEAAGNLTDSFVSLVYEDCLVQTPVIDDELSPHFMPWTQRAFCFNMLNPSSTLYLGVFDYDLGPFEDHDPIGRVAINMNMFRTNTVYTLKYNLYPSSNVKDRESIGSIVIRLRLDIPNEKLALIKSFKEPRPKIHINVTKEKSFKVVRYTCFGRDGCEIDCKEEKFDLDVMRSYVNEIFEYKKMFSYAINDAITSLVLWRGQVLVSVFGINMMLPIHSFLFYIASTTLVERPWLLPAFMLLSVSWILLVLSRSRIQHPSPWMRCPSFWYYLYTLKDGDKLNNNNNSNKSDQLRDDNDQPLYGDAYNNNNTAFEADKKNTRRNKFGQPTRINAYEGYEESVKYDKQWSDRIQNDLELNEKKQKLQEKLNEIGNDKIRTHVQNNTNTLIPLDLLGRLGRYQTYIGNVCRKFRYIRMIVTWEESILSFWIAFVFLAAGLVALLMPWKFILTWSSRIIVWGFFGPHMKIVDLVLKARSAQTDKNEIHAEKLMDKFNKHKQIARERREDAVKLKSIKSLRFGKYITLVPNFNLPRHYDRPLPESTARPFREGRRGSCIMRSFSSNTTLALMGDEGSKNNVVKTQSAAKTTYWIPGQQLYGKMIPRPEKGAIRNHELSIKERRRFDDLVDQLNSLQAAGSSVLVYGNKSSTFVRLLNKHRRQTMEQLKRTKNCLSNVKADEQEEVGGYELVPYTYTHESNASLSDDGGGDDDDDDNVDKANDNGWVPSDGEMVKTRNMIITNMMKSSNNRIIRLAYSSLKAYEQRMNLKLDSLVPYHKVGASKDAVESTNENSKNLLTCTKDKFCNTMVAVLQMNDSNPPVGDRHVNFSSDSNLTVGDTTDKAKNHQFNVVYNADDHSAKDISHGEVEEREKQEDVTLGEEKKGEVLEGQKVPKEIEYETEEGIPSPESQEEEEATFEGIEIIAVLGNKAVGEDLDNKKCQGDGSDEDNFIGDVNADVMKKGGLSTLYRSSESSFVAFYHHS